MTPYDLDDSPPRPSAPRLNTFTRWWPDGTFCPDERQHVAWTTIQTTATDVTAFGTAGPVEWCGCGLPAWVAATEPTP